MVQFARSAVPVFITVIVKGFGVPELTSSHVFTTLRPGVRHMKVALSFAVVVMLVSTVVQPHVTVPVSGSFCVSVVLQGSDTGPSVTGVPATHVCAGVGGQSVFARQVTEVLTEQWPASTFPTLESGGFGKLSFESVSVQLSSGAVPLFFTMYRTSTGSASMPSCAFQLAQKSLGLSPPFAASPAAVVVKPMSCHVTPPSQETCLSICTTQVRAMLQIAVFASTPCVSPPAA